MELLTAFIKKNLGNVERDVMILNLKIEKW
jgi:hypothetical protein